MGIFDEKSILTTNPEIAEWIKKTYKVLFDKEEEKEQGGSMNYGTTDGKIKDNTLNTGTSASDIKFEDDVFRWQGDYGYSIRPEKPFEGHLNVDPVFSGIKMRYLNLHHISIFYYISGGSIYYAIPAPTDSGELQFKKTDDLEKIIKELNLL